MIMQFVKPKPIDWTKYIEPKFQIYVPCGVTCTVDFVSENDYKQLLKKPRFKECQDKIYILNN